MARELTRQPESRDILQRFREEMDDVMRRFVPAGWDAAWQPAEFTPSADVSETEDALEIRMDLPGIKPDDVNVEVRDSLLSISGERREEKEERDKTWHRIERRSGSFSRAMTLPTAVDADKAQAGYHDGVLTVKLPKTEEAKGRRIAVAGG